MISLAFDNRETLTTFDSDVLKSALPPFSSSFALPAALLKVVVALPNSTEPSPENVVPSKV
ncbi:hypothetical protein D3C83_162310 [compost metagenome]